MSKIDVITQDIVDKVKAITEYSGRVGLAVGATDIDPINRDLTRPAAWIVFTGIPVIDSSQVSTVNVSVTYSYIVKVLIDYGLESELIATHFPLLEKTVDTIKGSGINNLPFHDWSFNGMSLESLDADRMVWVINFSIATSL